MVCFVRCCFYLFGGVLGFLVVVDKHLRKEGNFSFNDALNTFYLRLYGVRHMVKDHSDSERGNPLPPHRLLFPISSKGFLYASSHRQDNTYHSLCYTSRGALAETRNSSMGPPHVLRLTYMSIFMF